jgi:hypothetical protein
VQCSKKTIKKKQIFTRAQKLVNGTTCMTGSAVIFTRRLLGDILGAPPDPHSPTAETRGGTKHANFAPKDVKIEKNNPTFTKKIYFQLRAVQASSSNVAGLTRLHLFHKDTTIC